MASDVMPDLQQAGPTELQEWNRLGARLAVLAPERFRKILYHLGEVVAAQEVISRFDWRRMFRSTSENRPLA